MSHGDRPKPVVVGIDGSYAAVGAAEWAAKEAVHQDIPLRLVHVIASTEGPVPATDGYLAEESYAESSLCTACLAVEAIGLPVKIETAVLRGDVDAVLLVESKSARLICVGSVGIGRVARRMLGSTATTLAELAQSAVAIIRRTGDGPLPATGFIAVVIESTPGNALVVQWAMEEARVRRAPVLALEMAGRAQWRIDNEEFYRRLDRWLRRYPDVQVEVATTRLTLPRYLEGLIGGVQLVVIGGEDADQVTQLVGPHGIPILTHADCSVLVAR
jgi:nucleotide-binding universal stress UspA family protein